MTALRTDPGSAAARRPRTTAWRFTLAMLLVASSWIFWFEPPTPSLLGAYLAFGLEVAAVSALFLLLEMHIRRPTLGFLLAGVFAVLAALATVDALLLRITSTSLLESALLIRNSITRHPESLEIGVGVGEVALGALALAALFTLGGLLHRVLPRHEVTPARRRAVAAAALLLPALFVAEQAIARHADAYSLRDGAIPLYLKLFTTATQAPYTVRVPPPPAETDRAAVLARIRPPSAPKNVLYILLESARHDIIDPELTPTLHALHERSLHCTNAFTESILTAPAWNVLIMDRPAFTFHHDLQLAERDPHAAWPLRILKQAGYTIRISISSDFESNRYAQRITGTAGEVDEMQVASTRGRYMPDIADLISRDRVLSWIDRHADDEPFFYLLQLDCTHWDYYFDEASVVVEPYAEEVEPTNLMGQDQIDLLYHRYLNASRFLDNNIARVLDALRERSLLDETVIVLTSDHGESFVEGRVGHSVLHDDTRRVPLLFTAPGLDPARITGNVSHRDIFPTLFDILGIGGLREDDLLGSSLLDRPEGHPVLTMHGTMKRGDLVLGSAVFPFECTVREQTVTFRPTMARDGRGRPLAGAPDLPRTNAWQQALDEVAGSTRGGADR